MAATRHDLSSSRARVRAILILLLLVGSTGCSVCGSSVQPTELPPPPVTVSRLSIVGFSDTAVEGDELTLRVMAALSDQTSEDVTARATWESSNSAIATVNASGVLTAVGVGECDIRVTYRTVTTSQRLTVAPRFAGYGTVVGVLTDNVANRAIVGARVEVTDGPNTGRSAISDGNGYFSIGNVLNGTMTLRVTHDAFFQTDVQAVVQGNTRRDIQMRPLPPPPYAGTYNVGLTVAQDTCRQVTPAASGQVQLSGTATTVTVRIVERGITRSYNGQIGGDGSFSAVNGNGTTSSTGWGPSHTYSGSVSGRVSGNTVTGSERLNFTSGCPGQVLVINFSGAK